MRVFKALFILLILSIAPLTLAQEDCPAIVKAALDATDRTCSGIGRNQACYGNNHIEVTPRQGISLAFNKEGDIVSVPDLQTLQLSSMRLSDRSWGVALMKLQANLPDTLPDQNVTFLLFGNVSINDTSNQIVELLATATRSVNVRLSPSANASVIKALKKDEAVTTTGQLSDSSWIRVRLDNGSVGWVASDFLTGDFHRLPVTKPDASTFGPMQAFTFNTGLGDRPCAQAPDSGILIQTPQGAGTIELSANNVDIQLDSTVYLQAAPGNAMYVNVIDGHAVVTSNGASQVVPAGTVATIPLDTTGIASGSPQYPAPYDRLALVALPLKIALPVVVILKPKVLVADIPGAIDIANGLLPREGLWMQTETTTQIPLTVCFGPMSGLILGMVSETNLRNTFNDKRSIMTMPVHNTLTLYKTGEATYTGRNRSGVWEIVFTSPTNYHGTAMSWPENHTCSWDRDIVGIYLG